MTDRSPSFVLVTPGYLRVVASNRMIANELKPMTEFDPSTDSMIHDFLTNQMYPYHRDSGDDFIRRAQKRFDGKVEWDGLLLDGWTKDRYCGDVNS